MIRFFPFPAQRVLTAPLRFSLRRWVLSRSFNSGKEGSTGCDLFPWRQALLPLPSTKKSVSLSGTVDRGRAKAQLTGPFPLPNRTMHLPHIITICSIFQPFTNFCRSPNPHPYPYRRPRPLSGPARSPLRRGVKAHV